MHSVSSVAERAMLSVDRFISQAMTYAWASTLERRCPGREVAPPPGRSQPADEEDDGSGDICSPEAAPSTDDDQPLD